MNGHAIYFTPSFSDFATKRMYNHVLQEEKKTKQMAGAGIIIVLLEGIEDYGNVGLFHIFNQSKNLLYWVIFSLPHALSLVLKQAVKLSTTGPLRRDKK